MIRNALAILILALTGQSAPVDAPSALVAGPAIVSIESTLGAWRGRLVDAGGSARALEASFVDGLRPGTVFGYFRLAEPGRPDVTLRRLGRMDDDALRFDLKERGHLALRLVDGRLVGELVDPAGQLHHAVADSVELARLRR